MKITFSNLGRIKKTTLDLRPLTVILGQNNTNKTYLAYSIYGLFQEASEIAFEMIFNDEEVKKELKEISLVTEFTEEGGQISKLNEQDFTPIFQKFSERVWQTNSNKFKTRLSRFFQSDKKLFSKTNFTFAVQSEEIEKFLQETDDFSGVVSVNDGNLTEEANYDAKIQDGQIQISINSQIDESSLLYPPVEWFTENLFTRLFGIPFLLPSERLTLVTTYKLLNNRLYKNTREWLRSGRAKNPLSAHDRANIFRERGDVSYPLPIEDFLDFLGDIDFLTKVKSLKTPFQTLAKIIEMEIQSGNQTYLQPTKLGGREIRVAVNPEVDIDLYLASSSIKQLASLLLFLRHAAADGDLLIIDEPEMGLHPEAQAKLLEVLAILVNLGVKVLVTTHSPYFMAHLNNLLNDETDAKTLRRQASALYLKDSRAFLLSNKISAYEMKDKGAEGCVLEDLHDPDYGIRWDTLSDVSVDIQQKYFEIAAKGRKSTNGKKR